MYRHAIALFNQWKTKPNRCPLILRGARQVGKTWVVREFGKQFSSFLELNLEANPELHSVFNTHFGKPEKLVHELSALLETQIIPGETLLFIDEIQECSNALLSLRYFKEKMPDLHVMSAGSLLEFTLKKLSFPVGRIEFQYLFPMNFEEFLVARNKKIWIKSIQELSIKNPIPKTLHEELLNEVATYSLVGGMPQAVQAFIDTGDFLKVQEVHQILIASFRSDFHKYASLATVEHIKKIFDQVPRYFGQKFKYSNISLDVRSRELSKAVYLLEAAGLIYRVCHSSANGVPLSAERDLKKFKVFFVDIGLSHRILGMPLSRMFSEKKELLINKGALAEQLTAQELISLTPKNDSPALHYWHRELKSSQSEVDFVIADEERVLPVEVKSSATGSMKSLRLFMDEKKLDCGIKISTYPYSRHQDVITIPFYAISQIFEERLRG